MIARNSSFKYRGGNLDLKKVGAELGARYLVEGSVRRAGDRIRVTAQLIDTPSGDHVWAETYDPNVTDLFALQDEISATGSLSAISWHGASDLVDLHGAHALVVGFQVEPANFETREIVHEESVHAHSIETADVAREQLLFLIIGEIKWGESFRRIGFHRGAEDMIAQNLATKMVDRKD